MTLEEKVGQLFIVRPDALETGFENSVVNNDDIGGVTYVDDMMKNAMEKYHVGGFVLFEKNIVDGEQLKKFTDDLQGMSEIPLLIGVNELGGDFAPIANNVNFNVKLFGNMKKQLDKMTKFVRYHTQNSSLFADKYFSGIFIQPAAHF